MLIKSFLAFGAGFISFLSPCVLPLIPGYISYISGESLGDIVEKQKKVILKTVLFSLGFSLVFISFGATASLIGNILLENSNTLRIIAGIIIIIFSLQLIGILNLNFLFFINTPLIFWKSIVLSTDCFTISTSGNSGI